MRVLTSFCPRFIPSRIDDVSYIYAFSDYKPTTVKVLYSKSPKTLSCARGSVPYARCARRIPARNGYVARRVSLQNYNVFTCSRGTKGAHSRIPRFLASLLTFIFRFLISHPISPPFRSSFTLLVDLKYSSKTREYYSICTHIPSLSRSLLARSKPVLISVVCFLHVLCFLRTLV